MRSLAAATSLPKFMASSSRQKSRVFCRELPRVTPTMPLSLQEVDDGSRPLVLRRKTIPTLNPFPKVM